MSEMLAGGHPRLLEDGNTRLLIDGNPRLRKDGNHLLLADENPRLIADGKTRLLADGNARLLADGNNRLIEDGNPRLLRRRMSSLGEWQAGLAELLASRMAAFENKLFDFISDQDELVSIDKFKKLLRETGLKDTDFRLKETMSNFQAVLKRQLNDEHDVRGMLDRSTFIECVSDNIELISKALTSQFVIPEFQTFTDYIDKIYQNCKNNTNGKPAQYIPQLARVNPDYWGVAVCTVDGQRYELGNTNIPFSVQSVIKPLNYALTLNELSSEVVHKYVGQEPSGMSFNEITLDNQYKPHNPMINAGAIVISSLLKKGLRLADRFDYSPKKGETDLRYCYKVLYDICFLEEAMESMRRLAGQEHISFNNSVYLSERATADRNFALGYYMRENDCFPPDTDLVETLEFCLQLDSIEVTATSGSVIAATLANGGICPTTGDKVLDSEAVRNTLSLMHSCGMNDYSGQFAFKVGLPSKSGSSGGVMLVIPNVMGIFMWSPPLDKWGNSCRGVQFCQELVANFNFHNYDNLKHTSRKYDPRVRATESKAQDVVNIMFSAYNGDVTAMRRYALLGMDMSLADYDGRTALHLAAAEGHEEIVRFLLDRCKVNAHHKDRWNSTAYDDARHFQHEEVANILLAHMKSHPPSEGNFSIEDFGEKMRKIHTLS